LFDCVQLLYPKVLVGTPTSKYKDYCADEFITQLKALLYPNYEALIVDNSADSNYHNKFINQGIKTIYEAPKGREAREYMTTCNNIIRQYAIDNNFDYILSLESDIFVIPDIIQKLLFHNKPVVGITYFLFDNEANIAMTMKHDILDDFINIRLCGNNETFLDFDGSLKNVTGMGIGCTLIHKSVFTKTSFRVDKNRVGHADSFFYEDLLLQGVPVYLDTTYMATHKNSDWTTIIDNQKTHDRINQLKQ
jgi:hypothetical protein